MPRYCPINIDIEHIRCLVVGGGRIAARKVAMLLDYGADVTIISPDISPALEVMISHAKIRYIKRLYIEGDCKGMRLVIVATDDEKLNIEVAREAISLGCLVNVVDRPELSNFIVPATLKRGDLQISVSTSGHSPALARRIRERLEMEFGPEYEVLLELLGEARKRTLAEIADPERRREIFFKIVDSDILSLIKEGKEQKAKKRLEEFI